MFSNKVSHVIQAWEALDKIANFLQWGCMGKMTHPQFLIYYSKTGQLGASKWFFLNSGINAEYKFRITGPTMP